MKKPISVNSVRTKFLPPTSSQGPRILATTASPGGPRTVIPCDDLEPTEWCGGAEQHRQAAQIHLDRKHEYAAKITGLGYGFDNQYFWAWEVTE